MEIRFSCGSCGKRYIVPGEISGRVVRCAGCGLDMVIPSASGAEVSEPAPAKVTPFLYCCACRGRVDRPPACPHCSRKSKKSGSARLMFIGPPGVVWVSDSDRVLYQMIPGLHEGSGACFQYASHVGSFWPIPLCRGCDCRQIAIAPGGRSLPFVDYLEELGKLSLDRKHAVMGKGNWELFAAGLVSWPDVVTPARVREFHEVMDCKRLTIPQMVNAGIPEADAKAAWERVYTPERLAADARRREAIERLRGYGLSTEDIAREAAARLAGRIFPPRRGV